MQEPCTVLEAVAGIGVQRAIQARLSLDASVGISSAFFIDDGFQAASGAGSADGDFSERTIMLRIGTSYAFQ